MFGPVNAPGASYLELESLVNSIIAGEVSTPLTADDGEILCTDDGVELLAHRTFDFDKAAAAAISAHNESAGSHPTFLTA